MYCYDDKKHKNMTLKDSSLLGSLNTADQASLAPPPPGLPMLEPPTVRPPQCWVSIAVCHAAGVPAAVTALSYYVVRRNTTAVLSGHSDGAVRIHHVTDQVNR